MATTTAAPQLLKIPEVAQRLGISRSTVYELIAAGKLPRHNVGTPRQPRTRISEADLADYIASTAVPGPGRGRRRAA